MAACGATPDLNSPGAGEQRWRTAGKAGLLLKCRLAHDMRGDDAAFVAEDHQREQLLGQAFAALETESQFRRGARVEDDEVGFLAQREIADEFVEIERLGAAQRGEEPGAQRRQRALVQLRHLVGLAQRADQAE